MTVCFVRYCASHATLAAQEHARQSKCYFTCFIFIFFAVASVVFILVVYNSFANDLLQFIRRLYKILYTFLAKQFWI